MRTDWKASLCLLALGAFICLAGPATADRAGWPDPPGGWDIVYEGQVDPLTDGWNNGGGSDDPGGYNPGDVTNVTLPGEGDTEDGINPAADAIVLQLQDDSTGTDGTGRKIKFTRPFAGDYVAPGTPVLAAQEANLINVDGGVTILVRWKVIPGTIVEPNFANRIYEHYLVGIDASDNANDRCGVNVGEADAQWAGGDQDGFSTPIAVDMTTDFVAMWLVLEPAPLESSPDPAIRIQNFQGTMYLDGAAAPAAVVMFGPGDIGNDLVWGTADDNAAANWFSDGDDHSDAGAGGTEEGKAVATFGPGRTPGTITVQYDYICWKKGAHFPPSGPPDAPVLNAQNVGASVRLSWADLANEDNYEVERREDVTTSTFAQIAVVAAEAIGYQDDTVAPSTTYVYRVRGVNNQGAGPYSNEVTITTRGALRARDWLLYDQQ